MESIFWKNIPKSQNGVKIWSEMLAYIVFGICSVFFGTVA